MRLLLSVCLALGLALSLCPTPSVAPFPVDDPRAVFNAFIIPWWDRAPLSTRQFLHRHLTGDPLPPEERGARLRYGGPNARGPVFRHRQ